MYLWTCRSRSRGHTFPLRRLELRHWSVAPKQKQLVQPWGLEGSKKKPPSLQASHLGPATCFCKQHNDATQTREVSGPQEEERASPCRDTSRCLGGTRPESLHHGYSCKEDTRGSDSIPQRSGRTDAHRSEACNYTKVRHDHSEPEATCTH